MMWPLERLLGIIVMQFQDEMNPPCSSLPLVVQSPSWKYTVTPGTTGLTRFASDRRMFQTSPLRYPARVRRVGSHSSLVKATLGCSGLSGRLPGRFSPPLLTARSARCCRLPLVCSGFDNDELDICGLWLCARAFAPVESDLRRLVGAKGRVRSCARMCARIISTMRSSQAVEEEALWEN